MLYSGAKGTMTHKGSAHETEKIDVKRLRAFAAGEICLA